MASPSVTYSFSNSTTADASQVNQNFTDLINGASDGTKDYSISALTCAGTATLNGNVNLGNASGDDLTITASLASTLAVKTTYSYDFGSSTIGVRSIYLGSSDSAARTTRVIGATVASSWTLTLPTVAGTNKFGLTSNGSGTTTWTPMTSPSDTKNFSITCAVGSSALTIALKGYDGNDPSATNPVDIAFRSATAATGDSTVVSVTAATSVVVSSGSTLGNASAVESFLWVYAINDGGTVVLGVSSSLFDEGTVQSSTAEGGAGAADSNALIYSTAAKSSKAIRLLARLRSTQTTAGTWAAVPTEISLITSDFIAGTGFPCARYSGTPPTGTLNGGGFNNTTYGTKQLDSHNAMSGATYTIPCAGVYSISAYAGMSATYGAGNIAALQIVTSNGTYKGSQVGFTSAGILMPGVSVHGVRLAAGNTVVVQGLNQATTPTYASDGTESFFSIAMTGK